MSSGIMTTIIGLTAIANAYQFSKIYETKNVESFEPFAVALIITISILWIWHGLERNSYYSIIPPTLTLMLFTYIAMLMANSYG